jgi:hypothetical protein
MFSKLFGSKIRAPSFEASSPGAAENGHDDGGKVTTTNMLPLNCKHPPKSLATCKMLKLPYNLYNLSTLTYIYIYVYVYMYVYVCMYGEKNRYEFFLNYRSSNE